jgi:branched-chain amino acid transport system substrate-binding protein
MFGTTVDVSASFRAILEYCRKKGVQKIGVLVDNTRRGREVMLLLRGYAPEYGIKITGIQQFARGDADMMLQFRELKKSGAERVLVYGDKNAMPVIAESALFGAMPLAVPVQMLGADFVDSIRSSLNVWTALPPVAAGPFLSSSHPCAFAVQRFYLNMPEGYESRSIEEKLAAGAAWDAVHLAVQGIRDIEGRLSRRSLKEALEKLEDGYRGVSGFFQPDQRDHAGLDPNSLVVLELSGGKWSRPGEK